ncbi:MAG: hypothetical protein ACTSPE_00620 [Candidatus Thorarchaeota archaeon]
MIGRDGGDDISELVEEEVCMMIEYWRTLVMSCSWGVLVVSVQDCPDYPALFVTLWEHGRLLFETATIASPIPVFPLVGHGGTKARPRGVDLGSFVWGGGCNHAGDI